MTVYHNLFRFRTPLYNHMGKADFLYVEVEAPKGIILIMFSDSSLTFSAKIRKKLKGLAMIFAGQENPYIIFRSKEIYIYFKRNSKIPINLLK